MLLEYRLLKFKGEDVSHAVEQWLRANGELGQYGRSGEAEITEHDERHIRVAAPCWDLQGRQKRNLRTRTLTHDEMVQAIILYCKNHSIPLARKGRKIMRLMDGHLVLYYQLP